MLEAVAATPSAAAPSAPAKEAPTAPSPVRPVREKLATKPIAGERAVATDPVPPIEASTRPWPRIMEGVAERVARHRGQRLAQRFTSTLAAAIAQYGGRVEGDRVYAPPIPEATWRLIVEAACESITAVAGRAFVDRTIAAAERDATAAGASGADR
ncbi:MAG: hypothetical protein ACREIB_07635 [Pseudomonadota bacterium]